MRHRLTCIAAALLALGASQFPSPAVGAETNWCQFADTVPTDASSTRTAERALACLINRARTSRRIRKYSQPPLFRRVAKAHSKDMVARRFFSHSNPDGLRSKQRLTRAGFCSKQPCITAEDIYCRRGGNSTPRAALDEWMASSLHRRNLLRGAFRHLGVGAAVGSPSGRCDGEGAAVYTVVFGAQG